MYVQAYSGSDVVGTGEKNSPVASISKGLEVLYEQKENSDIEDGRLIIGDGTYYVDKSVSITSSSPFNDSGKLVLKAESGAKPVLTAGVNFEMTDAKKVTDEAVLSRLTDQNARAYLYELDLTSKIALSDIPPVGYPGSYNLNKWLTNKVSTNTCEVFIGGELMNVARYPNEGYKNITYVLHEGAIPRNWEDDVIGDDEYVEEADRDLTDTFKILYDYPNADNWTKADQALMFGYWKYDWATQTVPLASVDTARNVITSGHPSNYGVNAGARYYVFNLLEEIDSSGEYFIDRKTGKMYFYMPDNLNEDAKISVTIKNTYLIDITNASNIEIDSLNITGTRGRGINVTNGKNITVKNCEISNVADMGIGADGTNILIDNCYIHDVNGGIYLGGGTLSDLTPSNNIVSNCIIENFSRISKTYTRAINLSGVGNTATHNEISDGEHMAIGFSGVNNVISYNEVYDVCKEVDDAGAIYVGRTWVDRGNMIINNYIHDLRPSVMSDNTVAGIFLDDHYAGAYIEGNVFANITGDGVRGNGGREHTILNNVFVNCSLRGTYMKDVPPTKDFSTQLAILEASNYKNEVWQKEFPELYNILNNSYNFSVDHIYKNNLAVNCGEAGYIYGEHSTMYAKEISGNYTTDEDPGFKDMANNNYAITAEALASKIPGFKTIEFEKMGRQ